MKKQFIAICFILISFPAWAANYYVQKGGTAANKAATTACGAATAMSVATHNGETFSAGDIINLCNDGGTIDAKLVPPSSGTDGNPIIYKNATGTVNIAVAGDNDIFLNAKSDITIQGLNFTGGAKQIEGAGVTNRITITGNSFSAPEHTSIWFSKGVGITVSSNALTQAGFWAIVFYNDAGYVTDSAITWNTFVGAGGTSYVAYLDHSDNLAFSNNTITDWPVASVSGGLIRFLTIANPTVSNNTVVDSGGLIFNFAGTTGITGANNSATFTKTVASAGCPFYFTSSTGTLSNSIANKGVTGDGLGNFQFLAGSIVTLNTASSSYGVKSVLGQMDGFRVSGGSVVVCNDCTAFNNSGDGFSTDTDTTSLTCNRCSAYDNGDATDAGSGDGYTGHDTSTFNIYESLAWGNYKSGASMVQTSTGIIANCTFYNNYEATQTGNYGIFISSSGNWVFKNNITANHEYEIFIVNTASGTLDIDYNNYYSSRGANAFVWQSGAATNFADWKTASSKDAHSVDANPLFLSSTNFQLGEGSPALDMGEAITVLHTSGSNIITGGDAARNTRLYGRGVDAGAYEKSQLKQVDELFNLFAPKYYTIP